MLRPCFPESGWASARRREAVNEFLFTLLVCAAFASLIKAVMILGHKPFRHPYIFVPTPQEGGCTHHSLHTTFSFILHLLLGKPFELSVISNLTVIVLEN